MRDDRIAEIRRFIDFYNDGLEEADALANEILALPPPEWDSWLEAHPGARSFAFLTALLDKAPDALNVTELVARFSETISVPPEAELALVFLRVDAWRAFARTLRAAGRVEEAARSYATAAAIARAEPVMAPQLAEIEEEAAAPHAAPEELAKEIVALVDRAPLEALRLAGLACAFATAIPPGRYPPAELARMQAHAWKNHAIVLRNLARYSEALTLLQRAEEILVPFEALAYDRGLVQFARAVTLQEAGRYDGAASALAECKRVFLVHADVRVQMMYGIAEATFLYRTGSPGDARTAWAALLPVARAVGDDQALASIHNNLAYALIDLGEYAPAEDYLNEAVRLFAEIGHPVQVLRCELARGRILLRQRKVKRGIAHLQRTREQFLEHGLVEEAGLCGLEIVGAELARGFSAKAETLAREIVRDFTAAQLNRRAVTALGFLSEAIAARKASAVTVENVRHFIHALRTDPEAAFRATA
jgi:tetratricopeptide (TPR) repeat protein